MPRTEVSSSGMAKKDVVREKSKKKKTPIFSGEKRRAVVGSDPSVTVTSLPAAWGPPQNRPTDCLKQHY